MLAFVALSTACSFSSNFVVINSSNDVIRVRYVLKERDNSVVPVSLPEVPSIKPVAELDEQTSWRQLPSSQYRFNPDTRTAVVVLRPNEALRVEQIGEVFCSNAADKIASFSIEEIEITGAAGELKVQGDQVLKSFLPLKKQTCALTYR